MNMHTIFVFTVAFWAMCTSAAPAFESTGNTTTRISDTENPSTVDLSSKNHDFSNGFLPDIGPNAIMGSVVMPDGTVLSDDGLFGGSMGGGSQVEAAPHTATVIVTMMDGP